MYKQLQIVIFFKKKLLFSELIFQPLSKPLVKIILLYFSIFFNKNGQLIFFSECQDFSFPFPFLTN